MARMGTKEQQTAKKIERAALRDGLMWRDAMEWISEFDLSDYLQKDCRKGLQE